MKERASFTNLGSSMTMQLEYVQLINVSVNGFFEFEPYDWEQVFSFRL